MKIPENPLSNAAFVKFSQLGRLAVLVELKVRLLVNKIPSIQHFATAHSVKEAESHLIDFLLKESLIKPDEAKLIEVARKVRNKIFHCEFETALKYVEEFTGKTLKKSCVTGLKLDEADGSNILEQIEIFLEGRSKGIQVKGAFQVDQVKTTEAGIFGWLLEAFGNGLLDVSLDIIQQALVLIDKVIEETAKRDFEQS